MWIRTHKLSLLTLTLIVSCLFTAPARADETVTINLTGVKFQNNSNQSRTSAPAKVDAARRYAYAVDGMVKGDSGLLAIAFPSPTPLATVLETLSPGSSAALKGGINNLPGTLPVTLLHQMQSGSTDIGGLTVDFAATLQVDLDAKGYASFSITGVTLSPSFLVGSASFTSGTAIIRRVLCPADFNTDGFVTGDDYDLFVDAFAAGSQAADYNADGFVTGDDFDFFVDAFAAGC